MPQHRRPSHRRRRLHFEGLENRHLLATLTVTNSGDSGLGSLRQALLDADDNDRIEFSIPLSDPGRVYYEDDGAPGALSDVEPTSLPDSSLRFPDPDYAGYGWFSIQLVTALPEITQSGLTIDGTTQPGASSSRLLIELDGSQVAGAASGLAISGSNNVVQGLVINGFHGAGFTITDQLFPFEGQANRVLNSYIGTEVTGAYARGNDTGIVIGGQDNVVENNIIAGNNQHGAWIASGDPTASSPKATRATVKGNVIADNGLHGVRLQAAEGNMIEQNTVRANNERGISVELLANNNEFSGNFIHDNTSDGVTIDGAEGNQFRDNRIVSNGGNGVAVTGASGVSRHNAITQNEISSNAKLGIDLVEAVAVSGLVTANDHRDVDTPADGGNELQNYPLLSNIEVTAAGNNAFDVTVSGFFDSVQGADFTLEFFSSSDPDPSGHGEGEFFLGSTDVYGLSDELVTFAFPPVFIPDLQTVTTAVTTSGLPPVQDVELELSTSHSFPKDLEVFLVSPAGTRVLLFDGIDAFNSQQLNETVLDDEANEPISAARGPFTGKFQPEGSLSDFDGEDANGTWILEITDDFQNDDGPLDSAVLRLRTPQPFRTTIHNIPASQIGPYFTATATDEDGNTSELSAVLEATFPGRPPEIQGPHSVSAPEQSRTALTVTTAVAPGVVPTYSITGGADGGLFSIDRFTGELTFHTPPDFETPTDADADNVYEVEVRADDGSGMADVRTFDIRITNINEPPVISTGAASIVVGGDTDVLAVTAVDPDGDAVNYYISGGADRRRFSIGTSSGLLTFNFAPDFSVPGDVGKDNIYEVQVTAYDRSQAFTVQDIRVTVLDPNDPQVTTARVVNTNDSGPGSLRQALLDANNGRVQRIILDVAENDPGHLYYRDDGVPGSLSVAARATVQDGQIPDFDPDYPGPAQSWFTIRLASPLPPIRRPVTLCSCTADGRKVELDGQDVGPANGLDVFADRTSVSDLIINGFEGAGVYIGPGTPSSVENGAHVQLVGNSIGVDASGTMARGNLAHGVLVQGPNSNIEANVISSNGQSGVFILSPESDPADPDGANTADMFVTVSDNKIGMDITGTRNLGNGRHGVQLFATGRNVVRDNIIAASGGVDAATSGRGVSIELLGGAENEITGNVIRDNRADGITIAAARDNVILDNTIVSNQGNGVTVITGGANSGRNRISQNRIGSNAGLGIDLVGPNRQADGVTPNDSRDADTMGDGGNSLQNYPLIDDVTVTPAGQGTFDVDVSGFIDSTNGESFTLEFFSSLGVDPSGNGEGETFLGSTFINALDEHRQSFGFPSVFIADQQTVTATVAATGVFRVIDVDVLLDISHTFAMDLDVYLISPSGTRVLLFDRINAFNRESLIGTYLDDEAATAITAASVPFTGSFQPKGRLSDFDGEAAAGAWTLEITDRVVGDEGPLDRGVLLVKSLQSYQATFRNVPAGQLGPYFTATATDRFGNTSEFSASFAVPLPQRPPLITSDPLVSVPENSTTALTLTATDPDGDVVRFAISGGADRAAFTVDAATGELSFTASPDFEGPADEDRDNVYEVEITAADGERGSVASLVRVTVTDVVEAAPTARIVAVTPSPRAASVDAIAIVFSSAVTGFDLSDLSLTRTTDAVLSVWPGNATLVTADNFTWTVGSLSELTAESGNYELSLNASGSSISDLTGALLAAGATLRWTNGAGDANGDRRFDQFDVIQVLQSGKYLSALAARWSEGDFNGDGLFNQFDIVAAQQTQPAHYRQGPFSSRPQVQL